MAIKLGTGPPRPTKVRIPLSTGMQVEKSSDQVLTTSKPGEDEKLKQAVFIQHVAKLENSLPLEQVWVESKINF